MKEQNYHKFKRIEARIKELEESSNSMSNFIAELEQDFSERHDLLVDQVNTFMHEFIVKIEKLEQTSLKKTYFEQKGSENEKKD